MRRFRNSSGYNFWPSFVDAMSTLLIVVLFFLLLFVLAHYFMGRNLDTKNTEIDLLNIRLKDLATELSAERKSTADLTIRLNAQLAETEKLAGELAGVKDENTRALAQIALMEQDAKALKLRKNELEKDLKSERKISQDAKAHLAVLTAQTEKLTAELAKIRAVLDQAERQDKAQKAQIADLGKKLSPALAAKACEPASYRAGVLRPPRTVCL